MCGFLLIARAGRIVTADFREVREYRRILGCPSIQPDSYANLTTRAGNYVTLGPL